MKKILSILSKTLFYLIFALAIFIIANSLIQKSKGETVPMNFGWGYAVILTGSMEPNIPPNSCVIFHETETLEVGDVICYDSPSTTFPVTHRIQAINGDVITTKGDANNATDAPVEKEQVKGKVVAVLPPGMLPTIVYSVIGLTALLIFIPRTQKKKKERTELYEGQVA